MKKYLFYIYISTFLMGYLAWLVPAAAIAADCPTDRVAAALNLDFSPQSIAQNQTSKVTVSGKVGTWASGCNSISNAKVYLVYKYAGGQFKSGPLTASINKTLFPPGATITITDSVSWAKIGGGKAMTADSASVTVDGVVEGSVNFTKNFANKLTITKQTVTQTQRTGSQSGVPASTTPSVTLSGEACADLKAQIDAYGGGAVAQLPQYCNTNALYTKIVNFVYYIIGIAAVISLIYAGYMYMTAGTNDSTRKTAKNIITWTIAGVVVVVLAGLLVTAVVNLVVDNKLF